MRNLCWRVPNRRSTSLHLYTTEGDHSLCGIPLTGNGVHGKGALPLCRICLTEGRQIIPKFDPDDLDDVPVDALLDLIADLAPSEPMNQDEQGGCVWCGGSPSAYGYAGAREEDHAFDCPWLRAWKSGLTGKADHVG